MSGIDSLARPQTRALLFDALDRQPPDPLLSLIALYRQDKRAMKIDLGVGVYRDDQGGTPVMRSIKRAEQRLATSQPTKAYLGTEGDYRFVELLTPILFGAQLSTDHCLTGVQTPGGTGALRLAAEMIARGRPQARIWIGTPTWPNHGPIFGQAGLEVRSHAYYDSKTGDVDFGAMLDALGGARPGDVILLHGCCHNPTGAELSRDQWRILAGLLERRQLIPLIDLAYQGLGGGLDEDAWATRHVVASVPEAIVAYSCDKNFGLYRDRVGALWIKGADDTLIPAIRDNILVLARSLWSMPPDHGAAAVRIILEDVQLSEDWRFELEAMRNRIVRLRDALAAADPRLSRLGRQAGMFAMLPISRGAVLTLRETHGIYMAESGRINIAGLHDEIVEPFVAAIAPHLHR
jgi:aromatic-amino-acid transaminase